MNILTIASTTNPLNYALDQVQINFACFLDKFMIPWKQPIFDFPNPEIRCIFCPAQIFSWSRFRFKQLSFAKAHFTLLHLP